MKYTEEQEMEMVSLYEACETPEERDLVVDKLASKYNRERNSIIAKLSKLKIYKRKERVSKITGETPKTKEQLVRELETLHKKQAHAYDSLEKASKLVILQLLATAKE